MINLWGEKSNQLNCECFFNFDYIRHKQKQKQKSKVFFYFLPPSSKHKGEKDDRTYQAMLILPKINSSPDFGSP